MEQLKYLVNWYQSKKPKYRFGWWLATYFTASMLIAGNFDNLGFNGNTISSRNTNGNIIINPNGTGQVNFPDLSASTFSYFDANKNIVSKTATESTALLNAMVGDSGSGGTKGLVPAPGAGDAATGKFLKADGTWATAGGGGGGSLTWVEGTPSPELLREANVDVYSFSSGDAGVQALYATVKVPSSYIAGSPIKLKMPVYSIIDSGTFLISTVATLVRVGVDLYSTTANQRTSTNTAITSTAGNVGEPQAVDFDLTSSIGQINAVAVSAGDYIIVKLIRGSDTTTLPIRVLTFAAEVTIQ